MLNRRQQRAAEMLVYNPEMREKEIAAEVGVAPKTLWVWKTKTPEFAEYYHELCERAFKEMEGLAIQKLRDNVRKGNQKAIEYTLDYLGYHATQKVSADINTDINITIEE